MWGVPNLRGARLGGSAPDLSAGTTQRRSQRVSQRLSQRLNRLHPRGSGVPSERRQEQSLRRGSSRVSRRPDTSQRQGSLRMLSHDDQLLHDAADVDGLLKSLRKEAMDEESTGRPRRRASTVTGLPNSPDATARTYHEAADAIIEAARRSKGGGSAGVDDFGRRLVREGTRSPSPLRERRVSILLRQSTAPGVRPEIAEEQRLQRIMLAPDSRHRVQWDLFISCVALLSSLLTPLQLAWPESFRPIAPYYSLAALIDAIFVVDIAFNFRTACS